MPTLLRRLGFYVITAWAAISLNFFLPRIMPGDPVENMIIKFRGKLTPEAITALRSLFGQDDSSIWSQYLAYWKGLFRLDFGTSYAFYPTPVADVINQSIWWTLVLITVCTVLSFVIGTTLGAIVGWKRGTWLDALVPVTTFISSIPYFWFALILALFTSVVMGWFPLSGGYDVATDIGLNWPFISSAIYHAILPALTIIIASIGGWLLGMRNMMVTTLAEDYVLMAEAKGLKSRRIVLRYAARNAVLPSLSSFAMSLGFVVGGSIITETVFNYPGIGTILYRAALSQDYPLMQAIFLAITLLVLIANFTADIAYAYLDPRTRQES